MKTKLANRVNNIKPSPTLEITAKAKAMKAQGIDIVSFGAGEPDFDTPENIKRVAVDAIGKGHTKYTPVGGIDQLKDAIISKLKNDNGLTYDKSEILVSCGAKHSLYNISQALFEEGDEIIIQTPYWVSYPDQVILAGAVPVIAETSEDNNFLLTADILKKCISKKTKAIILNFPSNPSGCTFSKEDLKTIAEIAVENNILIISDEIYEKITYDGFQHISIASLGEEIKQHTLVVNGVSKAYSMTGWRIGYTAGDKNLISAMTKIQSQSTSNPTSIAQYAAEEALNGSQEAITAMVKEFDKRRNYIVDRFNAIDGVSCLKPKGAFYVFPNVSGLYGKTYKDTLIKDSMGFSAYLLSQANVAVVPGIAFGCDNNIRLSYATSMEQIEKGMNRIEEAIKK